MKKTVLQQLKEKELRIKDLTQIFNVNRSAIYQSIAGCGSREIRVYIALQLKKKPSELWPENDSYALECDDALYASRCINNKIQQKRTARAAKASEARYE